MLKAVIIEDELSAHLLLRNILYEYCPTIKYEGHATSLIESQELILNTNPDIIFLDINLEDCSAFEVLETIDHSQYKIIFTTAYEEYAVKAFRFEAIDYILKPYTPKDIITAVSRVHNRDNNSRLLDKLAQILPSQNKAFKSKISIPTAKGIIFIIADNILRVEADGSYCKMQTSDGQSILISKGLKDIELLLSKDGFFRAHASHLVNINHIKEFQKEDGGSLILSNMDSVPVSRRKKTALLELLATDLS